MFKLVNVLHCCSPGLCVHCWLFARSFKWNAMPRKLYYGQCFSRNAIEILLPCFRRTQPKDRQYLVFVGLSSESVRNFGGDFRVSLRRETSETGIGSRHCAIALSCNILKSDSLHSSCRYKASFAAFSFCEAKKWDPYIWTTQETSDNIRARNRIVT